MKLQLQIDPPMAAKIAEYFEANGMPQYANQLWHELSSASVYDRHFLETLTDTMFDARQAQMPTGTVLRSRFILGLISWGFPTPKATRAYFDNLKLLLSSLPKREQPGAVVLGIGSGRCGSTTLSAAFAALPASCATHENPPKIYWDPLEPQVQFHLERLRLMTDYFPLVFDAAHWWMRVLDRVVAEIPGTRAVGLMRDNEACAKSFLKFQGRGRRSFNHWAPPDSGLWLTQIWDPAYPKYPVPDGVLPDTVDAYATKYSMILRYVTEYNQEMTALAQRDPQRVMLFRTEEMDHPATLDRLRRELNVPLVMPAKLRNVGNNKEGALPDVWL